MRMQETADFYAGRAARWHARLYRILENRVEVISEKNALFAIRDEMHDNLADMCRDGSNLDCVELYLPLFDALAELTWALRREPYDRERLEISRDLIAEAYELASSPLLIS